VPVHQQLILAATQKSNGSGVANLILLGGFAILIVLFMRSRKNSRRRTESLRSAIQVGQKVMTSSGIIATVVGSDDESFDLEVADGVVMKFVKAAVTKVLAEPLNPADVLDEAPEVPETPPIFADGGADPAKSSSEP
jgi:preprotein translocase subunit YajC